MSQDLFSIYSWVLLATMTQLMFNKTLNSGCISHVKSFPFQQVSEKTPLKHQDLSPPVEAKISLSGKNKNVAAEPYSMFFVP